jgi:hypothetical protein
MMLKELSKYVIGSYSFYVPFYSIYIKFHAIQDMIRRRLNVTAFQMQ